MLYLFFALKNLEEEIERKGVGVTFKAITKGYRENRNSNNRITRSS